MSRNGNWTWADIPELDGYNAIVTGANSGIGYETCKSLAMAGANVIMACRDLDKGKEAAERILTIQPRGMVKLMRLDLAETTSIHEFSDNFLIEFDQLHILANNAGVMALPERQVADTGAEMQFATNHLGHYALTGLLVDVIASTPGARVITVSSAFEALGKIRFGDINWEESYNKWLAYGQSKIANLLFAFELQRRFDDHTIDAISVAVHPGWTKTNLQSHSAFLRSLNPLLGQNPAAGALPTLYAATADDVMPGGYYGPDGWFQAHGYPTEVEPSARSKDRETAKRLWELSEEMTGVRYLNGSPGNGES